MPRLLGVDIPNDKSILISLQYLYGVGPNVARELCQKAGVESERKAKDLADEELSPDDFYRVEEAGPEARRSVAYQLDDAFGDESAEDL